MLFRFRSAGVLRAIVTLSAALSGVQACGGRSDMEEYSYATGDPVIAAGSSGTPSVGGAGSGGSRGGRGGGSSTGGSAGTVGIAGTEGIAGSFGIAGTTASGGAIGTGGTGIAGSFPGGAASAGSPQIGGAGGVAGGGPTITCGAASCDSNTQTCCAGLGGLQCAPLGSACEGAVLGCTTNTDCGANLCCFSITGDVTAASSCKPQCSTGGSRDRQLCEVDQDCRAPYRYCTPTVFGLNICTRRP